MMKSTMYVKSYEKPYIHSLMNFDKCIHSCNHLHNQDVKHFCHPIIFLIALFQVKFSFPCKPQETTDSLSVTID